MQPSLSTKVKISILALLWYNAIAGPMRPRQQVHTSKVEPPEHQKAVSLSSAVSVGAAGLAGTIMGAALGSPEIQSFVAELRSRESEPKKSRSKKNFGKHKNLPHIQEKTATARKRHPLPQKGSTFGSRVATVRQSAMEWTRTVCVPRLSEGFGVLQRAFRDAPLVIFDAVVRLWSAAVKLTMDACVFIAPFAANATMALATPILDEIRKDVTKEVTNRLKNYRQQEVPEERKA